MFLRVLFLLVLFRFLLLPLSRLALLGGVPVLPGARRCGGHKLDALVGPLAPSVRADAGDAVGLEIVPLAVGSTKGFSHLLPRQRLVCWLGWH
uniref:Putative secreted protein n=1 Tax=Ixodes ricinus TaxID=34613 RepID=A0A6B0U2G6_IXORI